MQQFNNLRAHAQSNGFVLPDTLEVSKRWIPFHDVKGSKKNGDCRYLLQEVGARHYVCDYGSWKGLWENHKWQSWASDTELSLEEIEEFKKTQEELRKARERERADASRKAVRLWSEMDGADPEHPYLVRKGIKPHIARQKGNALYLPIYNILTLEVQSLQRIYGDGTKRFLTSGDSKGYVMLGEMDGARQVYVCEGYATACTVYEATGEPTICAYSCYNCAWLATNMADMYPGIEWVLCQDLGQAGEKLAKDWLEMGLGRVCAPPEMEEGNDWNDYAQDHDLSEIAKLLKPKFLRTTSMQDFLKKDVPKRQWVLENMFERASVNMVYGPGGQGKSWTCMYIAWAISKGYSVFGRQSQKSQVCYIDAELPESMSQERWRDVADSYEAIHGHAIPELELFNLLNPDHDDLRIDLYSPECRRQFDEIMKRNDVVIFDNWTKLAIPKGGGYQDTEAAWTRFFGWCNEWVRKGKCVILVSHVTKGDSLAGTFRITADMFTQIRIDLPQESQKIDPTNPAVIIEFTKNRGIEEHYCVPTMWERLKHGQITAGGHKEPYMRLEPDPNKIGESFDAAACRKKR